jgi:hypothetical protein
MTITTEKGTKRTKWTKEDDIIVIYNGLAISFKEIGEILLLLWGNEDNHYPQSEGFDGAEMSLNFIKELFEKRELTEELLRKYRLIK